jgi:tetratricopeptide (TPR) repeat protein
MSCALGAFGPATRRQTDRGVRVSFGLSYHELPMRAATLFRLLGLLDAADFATWAAAALMGVSEQEAEDLLDQLVRAGLLEAVGADRARQVRYRLHDLLRLYACERSLAADGSEVRSAAVRGVLGAALHLAEEADRCLANPFIYPLYGDSPRHKLEDAILRRVVADPIAWFEAERMLLVGAVAQACRLGMTGYAWELTTALSQFLSTRRHLDAWRDCATRAAAAARAAGDVRGEAAAMLQHADRQGNAGRYGDAILSIRRALALLTSCGDTEAQAICWTTMAFMHRELGQLARAEQDAQRALALLGRAAPPAARGRAFIALGFTHLDQRRYADAAACFTRFLRIQQATHSVRGQAEALYCLGTVRLRQRRYAAAARLLAVAMRSARQAGDLMIAMPAQIRLGQTLIQVGRLDEARPLLEHAVRHVSPEDSPRFRAVALEALGQLHRAQARLEEAAPLIVEAQTLRQALAVSAAAVGEARHTPGR